MQKKALIIIALVVCLAFVGATAAEKTQTGTPSLHVSSNPFIALGQLRGMRANVGQFSEPEKVRTFLLEEEELIARYVINRYFRSPDERDMYWGQYYQDPGKWSVFYHYYHEEGAELQLTPKGEKLWEEFLEWRGSHNIDYLP